MPVRVGGYPWGLLERVPRNGARAAMRIRRRFEPAVRLERLGRALGDTLSSDISIVVRRVSPSADVPPATHSIHLETADRAAAVSVAPEPALVVALLSRLLGRPPAVSDVSAALSPPIRGALAALAVEAARATEPAFELRAFESGTDSRPGLRVEATVLVDDRPYGVVAFATERAGFPEPELQHPALATLGDLPIELRVVAAVSAASPDELGRLAVRDVWMPGAGWLAGQSFARGTTLRQALLTRAALSTAAGEIGVEIGTEGERLVLRNDVIALAAEPLPAGDDAHGDAGRGRGTMSESNDTLTALVLDAPLVVRVEVGSVTLTAREWASLRPGDVVETGLRVAGPVVLRVAGQEVARGELVDVDGELGVRIRELVRPGVAP